uniref:uncharacterized protein K02A2.6-like n=1 Tax=Styela clava TaxID=7725 RepID=UPI00193A2827|nr:uncharacterized protein K02A2.6-like [Styela clava]
MDTCQSSRKVIQLEMDAGAAVSIISNKDYQKHFKNEKLTPTAIKMKTYTGEPLKPLGLLPVEVQCGNEAAKLKLYVVEKGGPPFMGRDWIRALKVDWNEWDNKARQVTFAMRPRIGEELNRLEKEEIITKVPHSDWGTPIVAVTKPNGQIRLCGDFKVTVNPALKIDQYPFPRVEEIGLYRVNRMVYGIASAPAIWQRVLEQILQGLPKVACILDDMIITGSNDEDHLKNVGNVLKRLKWEKLVKAIVDAPRPENASQVRAFTDDEEYSLRCIFEVLPVTSTEIRKATTNEPILSKVVDLVLKSWPNKIKNDELQPYFNRRHELSVHEGCLLCGNRVVIPPKSRSRILEELHESHPGIVKMKALARSYVWWPQLTNSIENRVKECASCQGTPKMLNYLCGNFPQMRGNEFMLILQDRSWI